MCFILQGKFSLIKNSDIHHFNSTCVDVARMVTLALNEYPEGTLLVRELRNPRKLILDDPQDLRFRGRKPGGGLPRWRCWPSCAWPARESPIV